MPTVAESKSRTKSLLRTPPMTFFLKIGSNLASKIQKGKYLFNKYLKQKVINSFFLNPVQENQIEKLINNLGLNKSSGPYSIPTKVLKKAC